MRFKKGFTLVETLIVIGIIALLAAIAIPNLLRAKRAANESSAKSTLKTIAVSLENFFASNSDYPLATSELLGVSPPYLNVDYFIGVHSGYTYTSVLSAYDYTITASPTSTTAGSTTYTITTGGVLFPTN